MSLVTKDRRRIFCNNCFTFFLGKGVFSLTDCGHVFCSRCLPHGCRGPCKVCKKRELRKMLIDKMMPRPHQMMLFKETKAHSLSYKKVVQFHIDQDQLYIKHLLKELARVNRLNSCFKKRIEFLVKQCSKSVPSHMYTNIKQEPVDDSFMDSEHIANVDWNDDFDDLDDKAIQHSEDGNFIPQVANLSLKNGFSDIEMSLTPEKMQVEYSNGGSGVKTPKLRKIPQASIDRFLSERKGSLYNISGVSDYFPLSNPTTIPGFEKISSIFDPR